jgi:hypothetical protein
MQKVSKLKHNKKRNTAFLFEALVKELTKAVVYNKKAEQNLISGIIKEHFRKNTILEKELKLYKELVDTKEYPKEFAEKLVTRVKQEHDKLDEQEIFNQQSKLISKINKNIGIQVYDNFVPNYKTLATISQIFNRAVPQNQKILLENEMVGTLTAKLIKEEKKVEQIDKLTFKVAIQKFNTEYSSKVLPEQKDLLHKFINHAEDDIELKVYLSEEIQRIKGEIEQIRDNDIIKESAELSEKVKTLHEAVSTFKFNRVNEKIVEKMLTIYEFLHEVKN